jgi:hypothetical protein
VPPVEAPEVKRFIRQNGLLYRLGDEVEDFRAVLEGEGEIGDVGRGDGDVVRSGATAASQFENGAGGAGVRAEAGGFVGEEAWRGDESGTESEGTLQEAASIVTLIIHGLRVPCWVKK